MKNLDQTHTHTHKKKKKTKYHLFPSPSCTWWKILSLTSQWWQSHERNSDWFHEDLGPTLKDLVVEEFQVTRDPRKHRKHNSFHCQCCTTPLQACHTHHHEEFQPWLDEFFGGGRVEVVTQEKLSNNIRLKCTKLITIEHLSTEEALMDSWDDSGRWIDTMVFGLIFYVEGDETLAKGYVSAGYTATSLLPEAEVAETMMTWISFQAHCNATSQKPHLMGHSDIPAFWYGRFLGWLWLHVFFI